MITEEKIIKFIKDAINRKIDINSFYEDNVGETALFLTCNLPYPIQCHFLEPLLKLGANPNIEDGKNVSVLNRMIRNGLLVHLSSIELLIKYGANVHQGNSLLYACSLNKPIEFIKCLLDNGANPNVNALTFQAACKRGVEVIDLFLNAGVDLKHPRHLDILSELPYDDNLITYLLKKGANPNPKSIYNKDSFLKVVVDKDYQGIMNLIAAGANINNTNDISMKNRNLLEYCFITNKNDLAKKIIHLYSENNLENSINSFRKQAKSKKANQIISLLEIEVLNRKVGQNKINFKQPKL